MKKYLLLLVVAAAFSKISIAQKVMTEGLLQYAITVVDAGKKPEVAKAFEGASQTLMIKGYKAKLEFKSPLRNQTSVYDGQTGNGFIIKQAGADKYLMPLENGNWEKYHQRFRNVVFTKTSETKNIAGYNCTKATGTMADGGLLTVYYSADLTTLANGYDQSFATLGGIPFEYEISSNGVTVNYKVQSVQMTMVSSGNFDMPKSGYKLLEFGK
ncbi:MAG TPA: hypothetical protein VLC98_07700 [Phnomibacter sp.]|nr:hypothetical protein [Phnomibacter sp.]